MPSVDSTLLEKVTRSLARGVTGATATGPSGSILALAAGSYAFRPSIGDDTMPTGFDPRAAALFEATLEAAFLVANADGHFDAGERRAFEQVVVEACGGAVSADQLDGLLADLNDQLQEDGLDHRLKIVASGVSKSRGEHQTEVLRIAALLAEVSGGVSAQEQKVLGDLARALSLGDDAVSSALEAVKVALA